MLAVLLNRANRISVALVQRDAEEKSIKLEGFVHSAVPRIIFADRSKTKRALLNLASNAVKFTDTGRVRISVLMRTSPQRQLLHVAVSDTGIGVPAERQSLIGEPFVQADGSNTRKHGGLGLGLTIAERLVEVMGGTFGFVTKTGRGSAFWFDVPIA